MSTKNVTLKEKVNGALGDTLFPATTTPNVYDSAKRQALSATLVDTPDYEALGYAKFSTASAYTTGDKCYYNNELYKFTADKSAGDWDSTKVEQWSVEQDIEAYDEAIRSLISSQASADNKLADKEYVNDKVATDTATFRGTFNLVTDLELTTDATQGQIATALGTAVSGEDKNDYAFVQIPTSDATPTEIARIDRYKYTGLQWAFEYSLNNSGFTAEQWAAINSGITSSLVTAFGAKYDKPAGGIPASDMDTSTFDDEPIAGSNNLVKSGGVYNTPKIMDSQVKSDLDITDENNHVLARFKDGHLQTKEFDSRDIERTSFAKIDFLSKVLACKYSGKFMHISFDDTNSCISTLFSTTPASIYDIPFFDNLKSLHTTYGACFSCYVYVESLANVNNNYASEFQAAKNWLKWNFHTLDNKQYTSSVPINNDYNLGIQRLLIMCGNDEECLDNQMRANYWELSLDNALFVRNNSIHKSFIFCAKDAFSPSTGNYYLNDFQKQFVFNNGLLLDTDNQIIFVQTCARLDSDDYVNQSKNLIQTNIKWQKNCEILNHEWAFNLTRMTNFLQWAKETMNFQFGFFNNIYKII